MTIEAGKFYSGRNVLGRGKLLAITEDRKGYWLFWDYIGGGAVCLDTDEVEPWREPRRWKVEGWACARGASSWLCLNFKGPCEGCKPEARKRFTVELVEGEIDE